MGPPRSSAGLASASGRGHRARTRRRYRPDPTRRRASLRRRHERSDTRDADGGQRRKRVGGGSHRGGCRQCVGHRTPHEPPSATLTTLLFGGASVVLATQTWFLRPVLDQPQPHREVGVVGLLLLGVATAFGAPAYLALAFAAAAPAAWRDGRHKTPRRIGETPVARRQLADVWYPTHGQGSRASEGRPAGKFEDTRLTPAHQAIADDHELTRALGDKQGVSRADVARRAARGVIPGGRRHDLADPRPGVTDEAPDRTRRSRPFGRGARGSPQ